MAEETARSERVWDRLRRNRERNTALFTAAGIRPERAGAVVCPSCGTEESALFWSATRRRGRTVYLLCPVCEQARVRYNLGRNQVMDPVFNRHSVGGGLGSAFLILCIGGLFYFRDTPQVRAVIEDAHVARATAAATLHRLTDGRFGDRYALRYTTPPTGAGSLGGGAAISSGTRAAPRSPGGAPPRPRTTAEPAAAAGAALRSSAATYALPGDHRSAIDDFAAEVAARYGAAEAAALREVRYDSATRETRVVVDTASQAWQRWLAARPGGRRIER